MNGAQPSGPRTVDLPEAPRAEDLPLGSVVLVVLDGWGLAPPGPGNAVSLADTPTFDELWRIYPHTTLEASGTSVGLPDGQMGNSEVGHLNLGAGTIVKQDLVRIDEAIADGSFFENEALRKACFAAREGGRLHLLGLVSDGAVHSSMGHLRACIELAVREQVGDLVLHAFTDGRDTSPTSSLTYLADAQGWLDDAAARGTRARFGSVSGRYWAMDRDSRWDRIARAYNAIVHGDGIGAPTAEAAVKQAYGRDETDEFIQPTVIGSQDCDLRTGDSVLTFNFRPDRMRQLVMALGEDEFDSFDRGDPPRVLITTMTRYHEEWAYPVAFEPSRPELTIADLLTARGDRQLHVAETEKYPHVTYFFNGGGEDRRRGEEWCLVPSPRDVPTYDHKPEMSAHEVAERFVRLWGDAARAGEPFRFGLINFANADMVGHTGDVVAATRAVEAVDRCLAIVAGCVLGTGGGMIVTSDHGNADQMLAPDGSPDTAHSTNPVPLILTVEGVELAPGGVLGDVVPTILALLGIPKDERMRGKSLLPSTQQIGT